MRHIIFIIIIFLADSLHCQSTYKLTNYSDSIFVKDIKYDFSQVADTISMIQKMHLVKDAIIDNDTSSTWAVTGFDNYNSFVSNINIIENYPVPEFIQGIQDNFYYLDIDKDGDRDIIYNEWRPKSDFVYLDIIKAENLSWRRLDIYGCVITNPHFVDNKLIEFDTYTWACCDYDYDIYRNYVSNADSFNLNFCTGIIRSTEKPVKLDSSIAIPIKVISNKANIYSINNNALYLNKDEIYQSFISLGTSGYAYGERQLDDETYVFVELYTKNKIFSSEFDRVLVWIKRNDIKYER